MVFLFTVSNCASCCKTKVFLQQQGISFKERDILKEPLLVEELSNILDLANEMNQSIIAPRFAVYSRFSVNFDELKPAELVNLINQYPKLLRRPLIMTKNKLIIGFSEENMRELISEIS